MVVVILVALAWTIMAARGELQFDDGWSTCEVPPAVVVVLGFYIGLPVGLVIGTLVGKLAGRLRDKRWHVHAAAITCTLLVALPPVAILHSARSALAMIVVALALAIPASVLLERSTRPADLLPPARLS